LNVQEANSSRHHSGKPRSKKKTYASAPDRELHPGLVWDCKLALGLIAGVAEFVPIAGPVIGAVPALLLASTQDWHTVGWTLAVFVVVQQIESNLIMPLVAGRAVAVPPAVGLLAVVALGVLFGPLGLVLGYPLAIVIDVAVRKLYVRKTLGEEVEVTAEQSDSARRRLRK
jgi:predicted PurR-regulated permease PerM